MGEGGQRRHEDVLTQLQIPKKHFEDIASDIPLLKSDIICLNETWLDNDIIPENLEIPHYDLHLNSKGNGKGIAIYYKKDMFSHDWDIKEDHMQLSKFTSPYLDIIALYRSQRGTYSDLNQNIEMMRTEGKQTLVMGDFNFCYIKNTLNSTKKYLLNQNFTQLISEPTHIEGHCLDQAYLKGNTGARAETHSKYYTDHKGLAILIKRYIKGKLNSSHNLVFQAEVKWQEDEVTIEIEDEKQRRRNIYFNILYGSNESMLICNVHDKINTNISTKLKLVLLCQFLVWFG